MLENLLLRSKVKGHIGPHQGPVSQKYLSVVLSLIWSNLLKYVVICLVRFSNINLRPMAMYIIII